MATHHRAETHAGHNSTRQGQIRIERKTITSKTPAQAARDSALDLRTPSGKRLPY